MKSHVVLHNPAAMGHGVLSTLDVLVVCSVAAGCSSISRAGFEGGETLDIVQAAGNPQAIACAARQWPSNEFL
jgi:hypothetical protein